MRTYLGPVGQVRSGSRAGENDLLRGAGFSSLSRVEIATGEIVTRTADQIVAAVFSTSSASPHLFGSNRERFEHDLRALPSRRLAGRTLAERTRDIVLDIWRRVDGTSPRCRCVADRRWSASRLDSPARCCPHRCHPTVVPHSPCRRTSPSCQRKHRYGVNDPVPNRGRPNDTRVTFPGSGLNSGAPIERVGPAEPFESGEVPVGAAEHQSVLDRDGGQVRVGHKVGLRLPGKELREYLRVMITWLG